MKKRKQGHKDIGELSRGIKDELPAEIIEQILSRLPIKSLCMLRYVCRSWNDLIREPYFIKMQLNQSIHSDPKLLLLTDCEAFTVAFRGRSNRATAKELDFPFDFCTKFIGIAGSCNGLICFTVLPKHIVHIWNPSTGYKNTLPDVHCWSGTPLPSIYGLGFSYNPANDDYKVVRFMNPDSEYMVSEAAVHTLGMNSWRFTECFPYKIWVRSPGVSLNGTIHWSVFDSPDSLKGTRFIACFDLGKEKFRRMLMPDIRVQVDFLRLAVYEGLLTICYRSGGYYEIWVMQEYGDERSWTRLMSESLTNFREYGFGLEPLGSRRSGEIIFSNLRKRIVLYDPRTKKFRCVGFCSKPSCFRACTYVESLVSI